MNVVLKINNILVYEYYYSKFNNVDLIFFRMKRSVSLNMEVMLGELIVM